MLYHIRVIKQEYEIMENKNEKEAFSYTYSAREQEEVKNIRRKYLSREENTMERLRRLDQGVTQKATTVALIVGILGALIMGLGMSLAMSELREILGSHRDMAIVIGVVIGSVGIVLVSVAYPLYLHTLKKERQKIAPEILRLTDELMK